jgi:hypothetical protein
LLDPTQDAWADHFVVSGDEIVPVESSKDASYTLSTYDLNDERKVRRRRDRRLLIEDRLNLLALQEELDRLLELAERERTTDLQTFGRLLRKIKEFRDRGLSALSDLARYAAVPHDAPASCRCGSNENHSLPEALARQTLEVPNPPDLDREPPDLTRR